MNVFTAAAGAGLFFLFIFLSGFWLHRSGKPYNPIYFNIHKFIGLGAVVFLGTTVYRFHQADPLVSVEIFTVAFTAALFACTIVAGGLLNIEKPLPAVISTIHKIFPYLITLSTAISLSLLLNQ